MLIYFIHKADTIVKEKERNTKVKFKRNNNMTELRRNKRRR